MTDLLVTAGPTPDLDVADVAADLRPGETHPHPGLLRDALAARLAWSDTPAPWTDISGLGTSWLARWKDLYAFAVRSCTCEDPRSLYRDYADRTIQWLNTDRRAAAVADDVMETFISRMECELDEAAAVSGWMTMLEIIVPVSTPQTQVLDRLRANWHVRQRVELSSFGGTAIVAQSIPASIGTLLFGSARPGMIRFQESGYEWYSTTPSTVRDDEATLALAIEVFKASPMSITSAQRPVQAARGVTG